MVELFANSGDPDQMPHSATSELGLHCLPVTCLGVSSLHWVKILIFFQNLLNTKFNAMDEKRKITFYFMVSFVKSVYI